MLSIRVEFAPEIDDFYREICAKYWQLASDDSFIYTVPKIAKEFRLRNNDILWAVSSSCFAFLENVRCDVCDMAMPVKNRTALARINIDKEWTCQDCVDEARASEEQAIFRLLYEELEKALKEPLCIGKLCIDDLVNILALIRACGNESLEFINAYETGTRVQIGFSYEYDLDLLERMYERRLISIRPGTNPSYIELNDEMTGIKFHLNMVDWIIPHDTWESGLTHLVGMLERSLKEAVASPDRREELDVTITKYCVHECLGFIDYMLRDHNLPFRAGEKTRLVLEKLLQEFSVSQIYCLIWRASKDAAAFYQRGGVAKSHASNTLVGSIERAGERALANNWDIKSFRRNYSLPQSEASRVLFNFALGTDDGGFHLNKRYILGQSWPESTSDP